MLASLFSVEGRIGRLSYLLRIVALKALTITFLWGWFNAGLPYYDAWLIPTLLVILLAFALGYCFTARRLNDLNQVGWLLAILVLVPVLGAVLMVLPLLVFRGSAGPNRHS